MQGKNGDTDAETQSGRERVGVMEKVAQQKKDTAWEGLVDTVREGDSWMNGKSSINIYTLPCVE